jgi:hypothetical protein
MTPEEAASALDRELRRYPWFIAVGVGENSHRRPVLFVYVRSARHRELRTLAQGWKGYPVAIEATGTIRPLARKAMGARFGKWPEPVSN